MKLQKKLTAITAAMTLALMMTACGGGNQTGSDSAESTSDTTAASDSSDATDEEQNSTSSENTGETADLTLVLDWTPNTNHTGLYVAEANGYFADAGLHVTMVQPPDGGAEQMVASGDAEFGISFQDTMAPAISGDDPLPISAVAAVLQHNTSGLVSLKETGIDSFGKMTGHSYATWDSPTEQAILKKLVNDDGGDWDQVELISTYVEDIVAGLNADIDSVWIYAGWDKIRLDMEGIDINFLLLGDADSIFDYYSPVIIGNNNYISDNPEITNKFLEAVKKGYEFAAENPDEAADILLAAAPELDEALVKKSQEYLSTQYIADASSWGIIDENRWNAFYIWLVENDLVESDLELNAGLYADHL